MRMTDDIFKAFSDMKEMADCPKILQQACGSSIDNSGDAAPAAAEAAVMACKCEKKWTPSAQTGGLHYGGSAFTMNNQTESAKCWLTLARKRPRLVTY